MNQPPSSARRHAPAFSHTTVGGQRVYGLVEWDGSYRPTVIVGCCRRAVLREVIAILTGVVAAGGGVGSDEFQQDHPIPDPDEPVDVLTDWLHALHDDTTVPYVTLMEPDELVHTGDPLIVLESAAANPCHSRPAGPPTTIAVPAGPPAIVNGYPVLAAVAERDDATSWIVICRRTDHLPAPPPGRTGWYVTWRIWWAGDRWYGENGDGRRSDGLTWDQALQSLARRLHLPAPTPGVDPGVYLQMEDHTDTWNCPTCREPITEVYDNSTVGALLAELAAHRCAPTERPDAAGPHDTHGEPTDPHT